MQFFLIDLAAALAAVLGYLTFVAVSRRRARIVTLARRATLRTSR
jgi:hypothetical protein